MNDKPIRDRSMKEMLRVSKEIDEAAKIAKFYGFQPIIGPHIEKHDLDATKGMDQTEHQAEKAALLRIYFEDKMMALPQPIMLYVERPFPGSKEKKRPYRLESSLVSIGSYKSVCECISVQAGIKILRSLGYKDLEIEINTVGDKESMSEFQKKMAVFVRKNFNAFPPNLRQASKKDLFAIFKKNEEECKNFLEEAPKPLDFLSEASRLHFKEFLEFLEIMDVCYNINHCLVGDMDAGSEIIFSIKSDGEELARGLRFNRLAKKIGCKKDIPATILNISAKPKKALKKIKAKQVKPEFYLVQFGPEAKLKSFLVLEELYKAGASVIHSIAKDKLGSQMGVAEVSEAPYIILMGQKEALENSVIIRNSQTRAQELVPISELAARTKELI